MPIYEYLCQACAHRFEAKQKVSDPPLTTCVRCGQAVTKVISAPAIMFKGTGWYITDYSDKLKAPSAEGTNGNGSKDQKAPQPASDSAAATTSPSPQPAPSTSSAGSATPATSTTSSSSS